MSKVNNVLIFPAGSEIAFEIFNALKYSKFVNVYGATSANDHSELVYKNLIKGLPYIKDKGFIYSLNEVVEKYNIDYIFPAYDEAQCYLMENQQYIKAKIVSAPYDTVNLCRSKKDTYEFFKDEDFIPKTFDSIEKVKNFPVFVKPTRSQGSQGATLINNKNQLVEAVESDDSLVICEYLPGEEYTIDCFTNKNGKLLSAKMRSRDRIKMGIAVRSRIVEMPQKVFEIANKINDKLKFIGAWFFQIKKNINGEFRLLEISPRVPGTMGLSRNLGINYPVLTLFAMDGYDVTISDNQYNILLDRAFYSAYKIDIEYQTIYLDFDDTLIINDKVNTNLISFIYQSLNKGKDIILLSKHTTDIYIDLEKYHIDKSIFSKIIVIKQEDEKSNYIDKKDAIFIDDSFAERKKVKENCQIATFDVDMIEALIDWRM